LISNNNHSIITLPQIWCNIYWYQTVAGVWLSDYCLISIYITTALWQGYDWVIIVWYQYILQQLCGRGMIEWLLFDINIYYNNFVAGVWLSDYCLISIYITTTLWQGCDWVIIVWYQYILQQPQSFCNIYWYQTIVIQSYPCHKVVVIYIDIKQ
jgi:hypothetical protein